MENWIQPTTLKGEHVILRPLERNDEDAIKIAACDGELSKLWFTGVPDSKNTKTYIATALQKRKYNGEMPFVVIHKKTKQLIGMTRFCNVDEVNHRPEIGYTWYAKSHQRSPVNTECKLLLLTHAFEILQAIAVEFRTHWFNHDSRRAITRLGAKQDGIIRNHARCSNGIARDTVVFSIIDSEWPAVKHHLQYKLNF